MPPIVSAKGSYECSIAPGVDSKSSPGAKKSAGSGFPLAFFPGNFYDGEKMRKLPGGERTRRRFP
jgi:hypothetical protein